MKHEKLTIERVVFLVSFIFIAAAFVVTLFAPEDPKSILPYSRLVVLVVHGISTVLCLLLVFKPCFPLAIGVLLSESFITLNITYEQLGVFLFYACYVLLYIKGFMVKRTVQKTIAMAVFHLVSLGCVVTHGWDKLIIAIGSSCLSLVIYLWIYSILKARLSCIFPASVTYNDVIKNKQPGSKISLSEYGLTERQQNMILDNLQNNLSYKELSEKYFVSLSTVKKDFTEVFQKFNVSKIEELHLLLLRYQVNK